MARATSFATSKSPWARLLHLASIGSQRLARRHCSNDHGHPQMRSGQALRFGDKELQTRGPEQRAHLASANVPQGPTRISRPHRPKKNLHGRHRSRPPPARKKPRASCSPCFPTLKKFLKRRGGDLSVATAAGCHWRALALSRRSSFSTQPTEGIQRNVVHDIGRCAHPPEPRREAHDPGRRQKLAFALASVRTIASWTAGAPCRRGHERDDR